MPRKTRRASSTLAARDTYHVVGPEGDLAVKGEAPHALVTAQERAMRNFADEVTLTVERRSLFGPSTTLYRVTRTEDGHVLTWAVDPQD